MILHPTFTLDHDLARTNLTRLATDQGCDDPAEFTIDFLSDCTPEALNLAVDACSSGNFGEPGLTRDGAPGRIRVYPVYDTFHRDASDMLIAVEFGPDEPRTRWRLVNSYTVESSDYAAMDANLDDTLTAVEYVVADANAIVSAHQRDTAPTSLHGVAASIHRSGGADNAVVVQVDTDFEPDGSDGGPGLRVLINDDDAYIGTPYQPPEEDDQ